MVLDSMAAAADRRREALAATLVGHLDRGARANVARLFGQIRPEDVALLLGGLGSAHRLAAFNYLLADFPDAAGEVLTEMRSAQRLNLLEQLPAESAAALLARLPVDDAIFVLDALPTALEERLVETAGLRELAEFRSQRAYPDSSAGRLMESDLLALPEAITVQNAIAAIQGRREVEMIFYLYIVDRGRKLVGVTSLRRLLLSKPDQVLGEIMQREVIRVHVDTDQEEVARQAARYDLLAVPVVDSEERLVGIVTVDDILDVVKEEATEDLLKMAGTSESELLYEERVLAIARVRLPSLLVSLVGLLLTGILLERFQERFGDALFLLAFVPVIMGLSGSIGGQAAIVAVRGLASKGAGAVAGELGLAALLGRQLRVGAVLGVICGLLAGGAALLFHRRAELAFVVGLSLLLAVSLAALLGVVVPALLQRARIDPAVANGPLLTTVNDILAILIYFGLAAAMLGGLQS